MVKKLTAAKAKEILHDKEVHGHPLTEKQRRFFGAIASGKAPKKKENGGWLDKYEEGGEFLGTTNAGFDYNPAWGGQFAHGGEIMNVASPQNPIAQEGTEITPNPEVEYYNNWLTNRKPQLLNNIGGGNVDEEISKQVRNMSLAKELPIEGLLDEMKKRGKNPAGILESYNNSYGITYPAIININDKYEEEYNPAIISYRELSPDRDVKLHERVHAARHPYQSLPQVEKISEFIPVNHSYGDDPHEVYSRLMEFRRMNNIDPLKKFNMEDLREMRLSPSIKDRDIIHRYGDDQVLKLLNEIAQNKPTSQPTPTAQNGKEMSFYQHGNDWQPKTISEDGSEIPKYQVSGKPIKSKPYKNIVEKQKYWDSLTDKYGNYVNNRQVFIDMYDVPIPQYSIQPYQDNLFTTNEKNNIISVYPYLKQPIEEIENRITEYSKEAPTMTSWKKLINSRKDIDNPALLYSSLMEEGAVGFTNSYNDPNVTIDNFGTFSGYSNFGLDTIYNRADEFIKKGYLDKDFKNRISLEETKNEKGENVKSAYFSDLNDVISAKNAFLKQGRSVVDSMESKLGVKLSQEAKDYFTLMTYNYGENGTKEVMKKYKDAGILKNNKFLEDNSYPGYRQPHKNVMKRLQTAKMLKGENIFKRGGIIEDDMGQWSHPGEVTKINSSDITMKGVPYPVLGISNTGDRQMMYPGQDYQFEGDSVIEYPMAKYGINQLDEKTEEHLDNLLNFTNKPSKKGWLEKYS